MVTRTVTAILMLASLAVAQIPSGYVSYWKLDGNFTDENGTNNGTFADSAVFTEGVSGQALGVAGYVDLGHGLDSDLTGSFSIGGWVYTTARASYQSIITNTTWNAGFSIGEDGSWPGKMVFCFKGKAGAVDPGDINTYIKQWVHVIGVYDGTNVYYYRNGVPVDTMATDPMPVSGATLKLGKINGYLDEMIFYNRALNAGEVTALMSATRDTTAPVVSGLAAEQVPGFSALVTFTTDQIAYGTVEYTRDSVIARYDHKTAMTSHSTLINGLQVSDTWYYRVHAVNLQGYGSYTEWETLNVVLPAPDQKFSLHHSASSRPVSGDLVWPAAVGDADVCMYPDDKKAAAVVTIDDNSALWNNHTWWEAWGKKYDQKYTWFVNTAGIDGGSDQAGTWDGFRHLYSLGHAVQSHSHTHGNVALHTSGQLNWMEDYGKCRAWVEENIPGNFCITNAYPGGAFDNDPDTAAMYFASSRGVTATGNAPGRFAYTGTRASSSRLQSLVTSSLTSGNRGWACYIIHAVKVEDSTSVRGFLEFLHGHQDSLWVGTYLDLLKYNVSYHTHNLTMGDVSDSMISFTVTDSMLDTIYNEPLTVKVRIDNGWGGCFAMQGGHPVDAVVVEHGGDNYALVKAVPDRGEVTLVDRSSTPVISPAGGAIACSVQVDIMCADASADIYFTIDGTDPDSTATLYTGPFILKENTTVKAKAYTGADLPSGIVTASFTIATQVEDVVMSPAGGNHDSSVTVSLDCATPGAVIYYTTDGTDPDEGSTVYSAPFELTADAVVKAVAYQSCLAASNIARETFTVNSPLPSDTSLIVTVDNLDAATIGTWSSSTNMADYYGTDYYHDGNEGQGTKSITFTPDLPHTGIYKVYLRWNDGATRADNVPVLITHDAGTESLTVNMRTQGAQWILQGRYTFSAGTAGSLTLTNTGANGYVIADAARWVYDDTLTGAVTFPVVTKNGKRPALSVLSDGSVRYGTSADGPVRLGITDLAGRTLFTQDVPRQSAGSHHVPCPEKLNRTGVYVYRLVTPDGTIVVRQLLLK